MKKIKFRGWSRYNEQMIKPKYFISMDGLKLCDNDGFINKDYPEDIILMQFTGLLDKQGKEIYEGDIVNVSYGKQKESFRRKIIYNSKIASFIVSCGDNINSRILEISVFEVIGNIYENKELMR